MAVFGKLINQLVSAAPLCGDELIPLWQGEHTTKICISSLGFIKSINGVTTDSSGNIILTAEAISAIPIENYQTIIQNINNISNTIETLTNDFGTF